MESASFACRLAQHCCRNMLPTRRSTLACRAELCLLRGQLPAGRCCQYLFYPQGSGSLLTLAVVEPFKLVYQLGPDTCHGFLSHSLPLSRALKLVHKALVAAIDNPQPQLLLLQLPSLECGNYTTKRGLKLPRRSSTRDRVLYLAGLLIWRLASK